MTDRKCEGFMGRSPVLKILGAAALLVVLAANISCQSREGEDDKGSTPGSGRTDAERAEDKKEREAFLANMGEHYREAQALLDAGEWDQAEAAVEKFKRYDKLDFEDAGELYRTIRIGKLKQDAKGLPAAYPAENLELYRELQELEPGNESHGKKVALYTAKLEEEREKIADSDLEVLEWISYKTRYGDFVKAEGEVRNVSQRELKRITAVVSWQDGKGKEIIAESAILANSSLPPGEISPFKVIADYRPEMKKASIDFKHVLGDEIAAYVRLKSLPVALQPPEKAGEESSPEE